MTTPSRLELRALACERGERLLFRDLDLTVSKGEIIELSGPNGSGKSTLLRIVAGLSQAFQGEIFWHEQPIAHSRQSFLQNCLYLGHKTGVKGALTVMENLRWSISLQQVFNPAQAEQALREFRLHGLEHQRCDKLSAGQQRRVALARLRCSHAQLWLLDEPFTALDAQGAALIEDSLAAHRERGGSAIVATHQALRDFPGLRRVSLADGPATL